MPMPKNTKDESQDVVLIEGPTDDGKGLRAIRSRPGRLDMTELRAVKENQGVNDQEIVRLHPRKNAPFICDVTVLRHHPDGDETQPTENRSNGPLKVSTRAYRKNWDTVFGLSKLKSPVKPLLN